MGRFIYGAPACDDSLFPAENGMNNWPLWSKEPEFQAGEQNTSSDHHKACGCVHRQPRNEHDGRLKEYLSGLAREAKVQGHRFHLYLCSVWHVWDIAWAKSRLAVAPVAAVVLRAHAEKALSYLRITWHTLNTEDVLIVLLGRSAAGHAVQCLFAFREQF